MVSAAVRNANKPDAGGAGGGGGAGKDDANANAAAAGGAQPSGPTTRSTRHGGRRRREDDAAPAPNKRQKQYKFTPINTAADLTMSDSTAGESARDTFKCVAVAVCIVACRIAGTQQQVEVQPLCQHTCHACRFYLVRIFTTRRHISHSHKPCSLSSFYTPLNPTPTHAHTLRSRLKLHAVQWGGLADGASPEGTALGHQNGRPILRCVQGHVGTLAPDSYLKSFSRWGCVCSCACACANVHLLMDMCACVCMLCAEHTAALLCMGERLTSTAPFVAAYSTLPTTAAPPCCFLPHFTGLLLVLALLLRSW